MFLKGQCHEMDIFWRSKHFIQYLLFACLRWRFSRFFKSFFSLLYTIITFLFASLKLLTNAYLLRVTLSVIGRCSLVPNSQELTFHMGLPVWFYRITGDLRDFFLVFSKNLLHFSFNKININVLSTFLPLCQVSIILHRCHFCKLETKIHHRIFFLWECFYMCFLTLRC